MDFKEKLKDFRKSKSLTQKEFAEKYGFSRTTITELESGRKKPTLKMIEKISLATNTLTYFWLDTEDDINFNNFDGLKLIYKKLRKTGDINQDGVMNPKAKKLVDEMIAAEFRLLAQQGKKELED
ncbi:MAG: helix-turn-helix transcriptional regulator [Clostridium perfringens]|nr:helix-turn-helix transcriptional regulator [Clostridium perfringens]